MVKLTPLLRRSSKKSIRKSHKSISIDESVHESAGGSSRLAIVSQTSNNDDGIPGCSEALTNATKSHVSEIQEEMHSLSKERPMKDKRFEKSSSFKNITSRLVSSRMPKKKLKDPSSRKPTSTDLIKKQPHSPSRIRAILKKSNRFGRKSSSEAEIVSSRKQSEQNCCEHNVPNSKLNDSEASLSYDSQNGIKSGNEHNNETEELKDADNCESLYKIEGGIPKFPSQRRHERTDMCNFEYEANNAIVRINDSAAGISDVEIYLGEERLTSITDVASSENTSTDKDPGTNETDEDQDRINTYSAAGVSDVELLQNKSFAFTSEEELAENTPSDQESESEESDEAVSRQERDKAGNEDNLATDRVPNIARKDEETAEDRDEVADAAMLTMSSVASSLRKELGRATDIYTAVSQQFIEDFSMSSDSSQTDGDYSDSTENSLETGGESSESTDDSIESYVYSIWADEDTVDSTMCSETSNQLERLKRFEGSTTNSRLEHILEKAARNVISDILKDSALQEVGDQSYHLEDNSEIRVLRARLRLLEAQHRHAKEQAKDNEHRKAKEKALEIERLLYDFEDGSASSIVEKEAVAEANVAEPKEMQSTVDKGEEQEESKNVRKRAPMSFKKRAFSSVRKPVASIKAFLSTRNDIKLLDRNKAEHPVEENFYLPKHDRVGLLKDDPVSPPPESRHETERTAEFQFEREQPVVSPRHFKRTYSVPVQRGNGGSFPY